MSKNYLFVYGTLRSETDSAPYQNLIAPYCQLVGRGETRGCLFDIADYPGLLPSLKQEDRVIGEVYCLTTMDLLILIDKYEGPHYLRRKCRVTLEDGSHVSAWTYIYLRQVNPFKRIHSGDFLDRKNNGP